MSRAPYPLARIFAHPAMSAAQFERLCQDNDLEPIDQQDTSFQLRHKEKLDAAREKFGRPFAHQPGTNWKPRQTPVLTEWLQHQGSNSPEAA